MRRSANFREALSCFGGPWAVGIDAQVTAPIFARLVVLVDGLVDDGAIEERDRIVGRRLQAAGQEVQGSLVILLGIFGLGALEVGAGEVNDREGRGGLDGQATLEIGDGGIEVAIEQLGAAAGVQPLRVIRLGGNLAGDGGFGFEQGRGAIQPRGRGGASHKAHRAVRSLRNPNLQGPLGGVGGGQQLLYRGDTRRLQDQNEGGEHNRNAAENPPWNRSGGEEGLPEPSEDSAR